MEAFSYHDLPTGLVDRNPLDARRYDRDPAYPGTGDLPAAVRQMTPQASVIVLTRNAGERFQRVLSALRLCNGSDGAEVLVIDSGSTDGTVERALAHPGARVERISPEDFGHGRTRNLGARLARSDLLVYLVQDAIPVAPHFLEALRRPLADPRVAATFARQLATDQATPVERYYQETTYPRQQRRRSRPPPDRATIDSVFFSNVASAIRKEVWERFPFDPDLIMSEDQKWARQVLEAGLDIVYEPAAEVLHSHHYTLGELFRRNFDSGYSLVGVTQDTLAGMTRYESRYLAGGIRALVVRRQFRWVLSLLLREAVRASGFACGRRASWLPLGLRRRLSQHPAHWSSVAESSRH